MLDLAPEDELALIVETARKLAEEELLPDLREAESARVVSPDLRASWAELGFTALDLPEACDGAGLGCVVWASRMAITERPVVSAEANDHRAGRSESSTTW